ncbi:MAG: four helix bundle protein [Thermodesulfobacteriota bacterium]
MEKPHKKLDLWKAAMKSTTMIYKLTNKFPEEEKFGLVSQMRRAAISIPCNIAEGAARQGKREFKNFLSMAQGSLSELDTQLELTLLLGYVSAEDLRELWDQLLRIDKMLSGLIRSLTERTKNNKEKRSHA